MLTGEPPFPHSVDPLDLIYKHMAVFPKHLIEVLALAFAPPAYASFTTLPSDFNLFDQLFILYQVRPEVDMPISDIVGKLLSKNAEDRYQGASHSPYFTTYFSSI